MNISRTLVTFFSTHRKFLQKASLIMLGVLFFAGVLAALNQPHEGKVSEQAPEEKTAPVPPLPEAPAYPVHLSIPAIAVEARIQQLGLTPLGAMDVPSNTIDVGWFKYGSPPGTTGSAVIAGHFNGENNKAGVFARLHTLKKGDLVQVTSDTGTIRNFQVREIRDYDPGRADEVFTQNDDTAHLNLVTCEGAWDEKTQSYSKRLVVFTDLVE